MKSVIGAQTLTATDVHVVESAITREDLKRLAGGYPVEYGLEQFSTLRISPSFAQLRDAAGTRRVCPRDL